MPGTNCAILMYHALHDGLSPISIRPAEFQRQMQWLHDQNYSVLSLAELSLLLQSGRTLPEKSMAITFDDGYKDFYTIAFPILSEYGFPATVFLVTGFCDRDNSWPGQPKNLPLFELASWSQIDELSRYGIEFGAHTVSHPRLDRISFVSAEREIKDSKAAIEARLGKPVESFAYPYGKFSEDVKAIVRDHFTCACGTQAGLVQSTSDRYELDRIEIQYLRPDWVFKIISSRWAKPYLYSRNGLHKVRQIIKRDSY
jgi:peptidoglycan/xylan/chitin deacetylase (PgdA/CDA1 family)